MNNPPFRAVLFFLLITPFLFLGCSGSDDPPQAAPPEDSNQDFVAPTAHPYTEAVDDPFGIVVFNGFSVDGFIVNIGKNEEEFAVSWDISYNHDTFMYYEMDLFLINKASTTEADWENGRYIGQGMRLPGRAINSPRNYGTYRYAYNYAENTLLMENLLGEKPRPLDGFDGNLYLLCVGYTQIYERDYSSSYHKAHRILKLELENFR